MPDLTNALKDGARASASAARQRLRAALVVAEVALALVLLVGAALFIGSFVSVMRIDPGFKPDHVLTVQISPRVGSRTQPADSGPAFAAVVERVSQTPGVMHAAMVADGLPLTGGVRVTEIIDKARVISLSIRRVTPDYHQALAIPLRRGRLFNAQDRHGAPAVLIINELAARRYFAGEDPIGRTLPVDHGRTIVGVVGDVVGGGLEGGPLPEAYVPMAQARVSGGELAIRTSVDPYEVLPAVRAAVFAALPDVPLRNISTMEEQVAKQIAQRRINMLLLGLFGLLGLVISAVGIYGVMANFVSQRTREIGVRMALGATRACVVRMVLLKTVVLVSAGLSVGGVASWYLSAALRAFLFRLQPTDPRAFAAAALALAAAAIVATIVPARRAAGVDPIGALRTE